MSVINDPEKMKKIGRKMSLYMGITMSFSLTVIGLYQADDLTLGNVIFNSVISFSIMRIINLFFDSGAVAIGFLKERSIEPDSLKGRVFMALIISLINSPAMTFVMVTIGYLKSRNTEAEFPYLPILFRSMAISTVCAFILCLIFTPIFGKILVRKKEDE